MSNYRSTCSTCKFFDLDAGGARDHGLCRVNPPTVPNMSDTGVWPRVTPGSWCGAHQPDIERGRTPSAHVQGRTAQKFICSCGWMSDVFSPEKINDPVIARKEWMKHIRAIEGSGYCL